MCLLPIFLVLVPPTPLSRCCTSSCIVCSGPLDWLTWPLPERDESVAQGVALVETAAAVLPQKLRGEIGSAFHPSVFAVPKMEGIVDWIAATREALDLVGRKANCVCKYYPVPLRQLRPAAAFTRAFSTFWPQMPPAMLQKDENTLLSL